MVFTQYLRPDGRPREQLFEASDEIEALARELHAAGVALECEVLMDGTVSLTAEREDDEGEVEQLAMELVPNGPGVPPAVEKLIRDAHRQIASSPASKGGAS